MATVLIGGGSGFVGTHLSHRLRREGHRVRHLSRSPRAGAEFPTFAWDVDEQTIDEAALSEVDFVINLAGAGIADARWTEERKREIINSRTASTALLANTFARLDRRPRLYLSASAVGYYGDRGDTLLTESAEPGTGFLSRSCILWEEAVAQIGNLGIPTFINRTGIVLHPEAGALEKMLLPLKLRVSTYFGDGRQYYSWIHIDDLVGTYVHAIERELTGIYNGVAPYPERNRAFAAALGPALGKAAVVVPAPAPALQVALGEMRRTVLDSTRCSAAKIADTGFNFRFPRLTEALDDLLG